MTNNYQDMKKDMTADLLCPQVYFFDYEPV